jgi:hypothetical protein
MTVLREQLLEERAVALAGGVPQAVGEALVRLGAHVVQVGDVGPVQALIYDSAAAFGDGGVGGLTAALQDGWTVTRKVVTSEMIPGAWARKVVLLAPRSDAGAFADAARAALENLARTLSVEWARYGVTSTAIARGAETSDEELAELVCFLVSAAGDYFSGCLFELGAVR